MLIDPVVVNASPLICLGTVVLAQKRGVIHSVRETLSRIQNAGLWVSESLVDEFCRTVRER